MALEMTFKVGPHQVEVKPLWRAEWEYSVITLHTLRAAGYSELDIEPLPQPYNWHNIYCDICLEWDGNSSGTREVGVIMINLHNAYISENKLLVMVIDNVKGLSLVLNGQAKSKFFGAWQTFSLQQHRLSPSQCLQAPHAECVQRQSRDTPREAETKTIVQPWNTSLPISEEGYLHTLAPVIQELRVTMECRQQKADCESTIRWTTISLADSVFPKVRRIRLKKCPRCGKRTHRVQNCPVPRRVVRNFFQAEAHRIQLVDF